MRSQFSSAVVSVALVAVTLAGCSNSQNSEVTVLDLVPPTAEADVNQSDGSDAAGDLSAGAIGDDANTAEGGNSAAEGGNSAAEGGNSAGEGGDNPAEGGDGAATATEDPAAGRSDEAVAADVAEAVKSTSNVQLDMKIEDGAAVSGRTACTGVADTSTQYPIGLELILGPPGKIGSGTPRIVTRSYQDDATAQAAAGARIASLKSCVSRATQNMPNLEWGTIAVDRPIPGEQLWFPAGPVIETHVAYSLGPYYIVASNQVPVDTFIAGQVDAWSVSAVQRVVDTLEAEAGAPAAGTPVPGTDANPPAVAPTPAPTAADQ